MKTPHFNFVTADLIRSLIWIRLRLGCRNDSFPAGRKTLALWELLKSPKDKACDRDKSGTYLNVSEHFGEGV